MPDARITITGEDLASAVFDRVREAGGAALGQLSEQAEPLGALLKDTFEHPQAAIEDFGEKVGGWAKEQVGALAGELGGPLGTALEVAFGLAAALGLGFFELGHHAEEVGASIEKVHLTTGASVPELSNLKFAVEAVGGSFEQVNNSMFMFQNRMENSSAKVDAGLRLIGLSIEGIRSLSPDAQFLAISEALSKAGDNTNKAAAAMDIFGRQGRDLLPILVQNLGELTEKSEALGNTWSEHDAKAAHDFEIAAKTMATETSAAWTALGRDVAPVTNEMELGWERIKLAVANVVVTAVELLPNMADAIRHLLGSTGDLALATETAAAKQDVINRAIEEGAPKTIHYGDAVKYVNEQFERHKPAEVQAEEAADHWLAKLSDTAEKAMQAAAAQNLLTDGLAHYGVVQGEVTDFASQVEVPYQERLRQTLALQRQLQDEARRYEQAERSLADATRGYAGVLEDLGQDLTAQIRLDLDHKQSIENIALVYGVTKEQVKLLQQQEKDESDAVTRQNADAIAMLHEWEHEHDQTFKLAIQHEKDWRTEQQKRLDETNKAVLDTFKETKGYQDDYFDHVNQRALSSKDYQILKLDEWKTAQLDKFHGSQEQWAAYYQAVEDDAAIKLQEIEDKHSALFGDVKKMIDDIENGDTGWSAMFASTLVKTGSFKDAAVSIWDLLKQDVEKIVADMLSNFVNGYLAQAESALGGWLARLSGLGSGGGSGGWWQSLIGLIPGHGGDDGPGSPIPGGHFDDGGNWIPDPSRTGPGSGGPGDNPGHEAEGGVVYAAVGFPGRPQGTDTVPAWLTPNEGVVTTRGMATLGAGGLDNLNRGAGFGSTAALEAKVDELATHLKRSTDRMDSHMQMLPMLLKAALR